MTAGFDIPPRLLLMRHAKSSWDDKTLSDHDRPLNPRGQNASRRMAIFLRERGLTPGRIITSSAVRARQTAVPIEEEFGITSVILPQLYHASLATWVSEIAALRCVGRTLLIGHNPGLEDLVIQISGEEMHIPTGCIVCCRSMRGQPNWSVDQMEIEAVWRPKDL